MRSEITKLIFSLVLMLPLHLGYSQAGVGSGSNYLVITLVVISLLIFFFLIIQVSDNLLAIEARQTGADRSGANFGIFPNFRELFIPKLPVYTDQEPVTVLRRGHDILLEGEAKEVIGENLSVKTYAVQPINFMGIAPIPKMIVEEGAEVKAGDPLFFDKNRPEIKYVAPVSGELIAIKRGAKRAITEVVILADKQISYRELPAFNPDAATRDELVSYLMENGAWPLILQRPYNVIADPNEIPRDIFISTFDTAPLAPNLNLVVDGKAHAFQKGLDILNKLTGGTVYLGLSANGQSPPSPVFVNAEGVEKRWFHGPHPAGNVGIQIHHINPIGPRDTVWTLNVQGVITLGNLFLERRFNAERIVALTGAELKDPKYVRTFIGANIGDLIHDNLVSDNARLISGDPLSGFKKPLEGFLNFHDDQITVLEEGDDYEMFGWLLPLTLRPSISRTFPNFLFPDVRFRGNTNTHGEKRAFVVTGQYEQVLPMDIYLQHLMKAVLIKDFERMEGLGIHELVEEDVALAEFACTSKQPLQQILRNGLDLVREQG